MEDFVTVNISSDLIQADYTYYSLLLALYQSQMKQDSQPDSEGDDDGGGGGFSTVGGGLDVWQHGPCLSLLTAGPLNTLEQ